MDLDNSHGKHEILFVTSNIRPVPPSLRLFLELQELNYTPSVPNHL